MDSILAFVAFIEKYKVTGGAILSLAVAGIIGIVKLVVNKLNEGKRYPYVKPYFWGLSKNFNITVVLEYIPDENPSGYRQIQYSRPDQWRSKVVKVSFCCIFHKIVPLNDKDILTVQVRKKLKEKSILFNRIL